jgi:plastocyanin
MRFYGLALVSSAVVLGACGGGEKATKDTTAAAPTATTPTATPTPAPASGVAALPATGPTHTVKMIGDATGYRFDPKDITIKSGDAIDFVVTGTIGPHNVSFDPATIPAESKAQLEANMKDAISELQGPLLMNPPEHYVLSFAGIKPGKYPFHCTPHQAMGMQGTITVQ